MGADSGGAKELEVLSSEQVATSLAHPDKLYIGGRWVKPTSERRLRLVNPASETIFFDVAEATETDVEKAVLAARLAFDNGPWPRKTPAERASMMRTLADGLDRRASALEAAWTAQVGVPIGMANGSSVVASALLRYYADLAETYPFEDVRPSAGFQSKYAVVVREPVGVVAAIAPWNAPLLLMMMKVAPALAAGCTIVMKPSPETPLEAFMIAEAVEEAGFPDGAINLIPAGREVSDFLIRHPGIDKVAFTGSTAAGLHIASICAGRMARYTMELGGKSAAIILEDMPPETLGPLLAPVITSMSGQVCVNYSRVLVPRRRHDDYVESLAAAMSGTCVGDPLDPTTMMGPLALQRQVDRVQSYIDKAQAEGARLATGGGRPAHLDRGYYVEPTLFTGVSNDMTIAREEVFGPVTAIISYEDEAEAIGIANASEYGLSGGVYTMDTDRAYAIARQIRTGHLTQNGQDFDLTNPFGGFRKSGLGREGGREGIEPYLEIKTVFLPERPSRL